MKIKLPKYKTELEVDIYCDNCQAPLYEETKEVEYSFTTSGRLQLKINCECKQEAEEIINDCKKSDNCKRYEPI